MSKPRSPRIDIAALALSGLTTLLTLALLSYDPADPVPEPAYPLNLVYRPDTLVYPMSDQVNNWCGRTGAFTADLMLTICGFGAYYLVATLFVATVMLWLRRSISNPSSRVIGWILSLIGATTIVSMVSPRIWNGPVVGPGGVLGAICSGFLDQHFAKIGGLILAFSIFLSGMLLWTEYLIFQLLALAGIRSFERVLPRNRAARKTGSDLDREVERDDRRSTKSRRQQLDDAEDDDYEDDYEDESEWAEEDDQFEEEEDEYEAEYEDEGERADKQDDFIPAAKKALRGIIGRAAPSLRLGSAEDKDERQEVMEQLDEASRKEKTGDYDLPSINLLTEPEEYSFDEQEKECHRKAQVLEKTFRDFGFEVKVVDIETGPVIAQYEIALEAGLRLSKITGLADDLAIALRAPSVRIVAPIPGKNTVGIEVPNEQRQVVRLREVMNDSTPRIKKMQIPLYLGKDVAGNNLAVDLATMPHLLIAGRTGTGKSVCLNAIIGSILMTRRPDEVRMLMIDPKMVELSGYKTLPHLMHPVVTDMRKAEALLAWAVDKMNERYQLLAKAGVRNIVAYNSLSEEELMERIAAESEVDEQPDDVPIHMPYIVIVADEMADLMMTAGKEVEAHIIRLAQMSRAVGIHLILATQKPTVDVITGLIKSNLPARICFQVASRTDSRVVLDEMGADKLLGNGDMLFLSPGTSTLLRGQGTYLEDGEIIKIVDAVSTGEQNFVRELVQLKVDRPEGEAADDTGRQDDLYDSAVEVVIREGRGSISLLQRTLGIGYGRAARMIDWMAEDGVVGAYAGSSAREVIMTMSQWQGRSDGETQSKHDDAGLAVRSESNGDGDSGRILPMPGWQQKDDGDETAPNKDRQKASKRATVHDTADAENDSRLDELADEDIEETDEFDEEDEYEYDVDDYEYDPNAVENEEEAEEYEDDVDEDYDEDEEFEESA